MLIPRYPEGLKMLDVLRVVVFIKDDALTFVVAMALDA